MAKSTTNLDRQILISHAKAKLAEAKPGDECYCETCAKYRYKSSKEVYAAFSEESSLYACRVCNSYVLEGDAVPIPF